MAGANYITTRGLERIRRELEHLQKVVRPKVVEEVAAAAALGDRSENAEYIFGKKKMRDIDRRLGFLIKRLGHVIEVDPGEVESDKIVFGATVVVETEEGEEQTWRIYGEDEIDVENGIISWKSPLARALLGKEEGEAATVRTPQGVRELEILEVRYEPQDPLPEDLVFDGTRLRA